MRVLLLMAALGLTAGLSAAGPEDNWPQFRGTTGGVIADDPSLPESWSPTTNIAWKAEIPGIGWGSPVVWGDYVFVSTAISAGHDTPRGVTPGEYADKTERRVADIATGKDPDFKIPRRWMLYAFSVKTGKMKWAVQLRQGLPLEKKYLDNTYASETPVTDGKRVYVFHASAGLFAVDYNGKIVWQREVPLPVAPTTVATARNETLNRGGAADALPPTMLTDIGAAASPVVHNGRIYLTMDHEPRQWILFAFDAATGKEAWRVHKQKDQEAFGWSTPYIWTHALRTEIVTAGDLQVRSYDLDGTLLWEFGRLSVNTTPTPYEANGLLYVSSGYPTDRTRPVVAIRPGASGDISLKPGETSNAFVAWYQSQGASYMNSSLVYGDYHYTLHTQGFLLCHDAKTGRLVYNRQRIDVNSTGFTASLWAYNGKIWAISEEGDTYAIQPGPEFKVLAKNPLNQMVMATPAIARGSLFVRTATHLFRIATTR
ncbi:MAG: PQQ-binding-like beta-propeller repeat protein [Vicinamibacterales bacterium]|nr:PQQ-binding-like beta-propeller repeat protein [Vicinamibacterales bacterium]